MVANPQACLGNADDNTDTYVVCRLGNDSQIAIDAIQDVVQGNRVVKDLIGGLRAWTRDVDPNFPVY